MLSTKGLGRQSSAVDDGRPLGHWSLAAAGIDDGSPGDGMTCMDRRRVDCVTPRH